MLILPNDNIWLRGIFDLQELSSELLVEELLLSEGSIKPTNLCGLKELFLASHRLELSKCDDTSRFVSLQILFHLLHSLLPLEVDVVNEFSTRGGLVRFKLHLYLELLLLMIHVSHLHHEVDLPVVTEAECDVHNVVLVLINNARLRVVLVRDLLVDLL